MKKIFLFFTFITTLSALPNRQEVIMYYISEPNLELVEKKIKQRLDRLNSPASYAEFLDEIAEGFFKRASASTCSFNQEKTLLNITLGAWQKRSQECLPAMNAEDLHWITYSLYHLQLKYGGVNFYVDWYSAFLDATTNNIWNLEEKLQLEMLCFWCYFAGRDLSDYNCTIRKFIYYLTEKFSDKLEDLNRPIDKEIIMFFVSTLSRLSFLERHNLRSYNPNIYQKWETLKTFSFEATFPLVDIGEF